MGWRRVAAVAGRGEGGGDWDSQSFCQMSDGVKAARDVVINHGRAASEYAQQKTWGEERGEERGKERGEVRVRGVIGVEQTMQIGAISWAHFKVVKA